MTTDEELHQQVIAELNWDLALEAKHILVHVSDGTVTLSGEVSSHAEKWHAEEAASQVSRVVALINNIEVIVSSNHVRTDSDIVLAAVNALEWNASLAGHKISVNVSDGWLVLSGEVESEHQRQTAGYAVRYLQGIRGINNDITIKTHAYPDTIKADIESAFRRRASIDAHGIEVLVNHGEVTLTGAVASLPELEMARSTASGTAGVQRVVSHLIVSSHR
ncbi:BON domain-containing protein [Pseudomonas sp. KU26590]|uniref:BON domain-containing protein n=1 Tax=Pseudomonas sp. KU26590 TaxID=2991051 RepID=UPI00223E25A8|nr:BON domain-containing protein [Pseudomonas sp. KU26590]UZJ57995.1 BON domain-containing protein [Pseudomonas sp. KU26590]